ncbi:MAG TPA: glycosyltransferase [Spirochaetia bacterium]|nr:glycosyltransferase [Spirochaetia bacterium]
MSDPTVSVIIPTFNRSKLTIEAVGSVLRQSVRAAEIIVVDDGSTDGTAERLQEAAPQLSVLRIPHCGMPGAVRNAGAGRARGALLAFLDSDDLWEPAKLARQIGFHQAQPGVRISHTREVWLRDGRIVSQQTQRHRREGDVFADALVKCMIGPSTVMLERALFEESGGFREDLEIAEDYELWLRIVDHEPVGYIDEPLTLKRAHGGEAGDGQLSARYGQIEIFRIRALEDLLERDFFVRARAEVARAELARKCRIYAAGCRKRGKLEEAHLYELRSRSYTEIQHGSDAVLGAD